MNIKICLDNHPVFCGCDINIDLEYEIEKPDNSVGIVGGINIIAWCVTGVNGFTYKKSVLKSIEGYIRKRFNYYENRMYKDIEYNLGGTNDKRISLIR